MAHKLAKKVVEFESKIANASLDLYVLTGELQILIGVPTDELTLAI